MKIDGGGPVLCILAGMGVIALIYMAQQQSEDTRVPEVQGEAQVMGLGVQAAMRINAGTPLDMTHETHGWHPGYDPDPSSQPVTISKHRYPAVPGGNISTVIHKGWSSLMDSQPPGNDWFRNPPEAAVI